jgi:lipopolysaccharide/colanic/teichoic acid biosynthesis glycosyltransferase
MKNRYRIFKRVVDILFSFVAIVLLMPIFVVISVSVLLFLGRPILFKQVRPGLNEKPFYLAKFRSMNNKKNSEGELLPDKKRLNSFGKFLRSTSLDELPQLWSVLKGEMSLVGPRPLLMEYLPLYDLNQSRRHEVRPGITGWAQVNGRNNISWEERFDLDVWYVENCSFVLDLKILWLTFKKVVARENVSADGRVTVEKFKGSKNE